MPRTKHGLGRGLGALIPDLASPSPESVDIDLIVSNPFQPRRDMNESTLQELAESIRQHGLLQPLLVTRLDSDVGAPTYQVIAGGRRLEAARMAGLTQVPVVIRETTPRQGLELALVENLMREDLNALEEAEAYQRLLEEFELNQSEVSERVGRSRSAVANALRLLNLSEELRASLARDEISEGHARALLGLPEDCRRQAWELVVRKGLSVRQTEELARTWPAAEKATRRQRPRDVELEALEERLRASLGTRVNLSKGRRGGRITIHFYSDEELDGLLERLGALQG